MTSTISQRAQEQMSGGNELTLRPPRLPFDPRVEESFKIDRKGWKTLVEVIFPAIDDPNMIIAALAYCEKRGLDVFKRPVHIVQMYNKKLGKMVATVWPGISELRTTACRTKEYAGCDEIEFGPLVTQTFTGRVKGKDGWENISKTVTFHEWARLTVYRMVGGQRCPFVGPKVYWLEDYSDMSNSGVPNAMWDQRPIGQHEKIAEAAALRRAFPEEIGGDYSAEEMEGKATEARGFVEYAPAAAKPAQIAVKDQQPGNSKPEQAKLDEKPGHPTAPIQDHNPETGEVIKGDYTEAPPNGNYVDEPTPEECAAANAAVADDGPKGGNMSPKEILAWAEAKFASVTDPDELEPMFNNVVAPRFENKHYSNLWNQLLAVQRKHETRLMP